MPPSRLPRLVEPLGLRYDPAKAETEAEEIAFGRAPGEGRVAALVVESLAEDETVYSATYGTEIGPGWLLVVDADADADERAAAITAVVGHDEWTVQYAAITPVTECPECGAPMTWDAEMGAWDCGPEADGRHGFWDPDSLS